MSALEVNLTEQLNGWEGKINPFGILKKELLRYPPMTAGTSNSGESVPVPSGALEAMLNSLDSWSGILNAEGILALVNERWRAYEGPNPFLSGQTLGCDFGSTVRELAASKDGNLSIVALGLLAVLNGKVPRLRLEFPLRREAGTSWFGVTAARSADLVVIHQSDLTERMNINQRLRKAEMLFKATSETATDLISIVDAKGCSTFTSHSHSTVLGYSELEWRGLKVENLIHPDDREKYAAVLKEVFATSLSPFFEYRVLNKAGEWRFFEGRAAVVESGSMSRETVLLISRDISDRKQAEVERATMEVQLRQAQKLEAVGQLAAGIAHEINTPTQYISDNVRFLEEAFSSLCEILRKEGGLLAEATKDTALAGQAAGLLELIEKEDLDYLLEEVPRALQQSQEGLVRVSSIVKAMKVFSHPGTEGQVAVNLNQAVESTCIVARNEWKYVSDLETDLAPDLPTVICYPGEVNQMILNLVINAAHAIEATDRGTKGKGLIRVVTRREDPWVVIEVSDTGTGIPEKIRDQIFVPFFTTKPVGKGTGQGLSIVHSVAIKHGGRVEFQSEEGKGTTFTVRLPLST